MDTSHFAVHTSQKQLLNQLFPDESNADGGNDQSQRSATVGCDVKDTVFEHSCTRDVAQQPTAKGPHTNLASQSVCAGMSPFDVACARSKGCAL
eukprot:362355-Chlamydomonas_euryale.AAC.2